MAPPVNSYATLTSALQDFAHRADIGNALASDSVIPTDYFIQAALEAITSDIPDLNFGNYIRAMETAYGPATIQGGIAIVPSDWLGAKLLTISDSQSNMWPLLMKDTPWLYAVYPVRQASGLPAYVARDVMPPASFTGSISLTVDEDITVDSDITVDFYGNLTVSAMASGYLQTGQVLAGAGMPTGVQTAIIIIQQISGTTGGIGVYQVGNCTANIASQAMTAGGSIFAFGPYPDSNYQVGGTYYSQIPSLSSANPTNWVTSIAPMMLHAACMVEVGKFLLDDALISRWSQVYQQRLKALVDRDKAERWSMGTMAIETDTSW